MKTFRMWHLPAMVLAFGAALILSPSCKAQADVSPDHFDGNEPWAADQTASQPTSKSVTSKSKQAPAVQARSGQKGSAPARQLSAKRDASLTPATQSAALAVDEKRRIVPSNGPKQQ